MTALEVTPAPHGTVRIETPRLLLASWREEQVQDFLAIASDPEVMRYIGSGRPWGEEQARAFVERQIAAEAAHGFCLWGLIERAAGRLIGQCGLQRAGDTGETEIGWWLARDRWGQGLATEAARAVVAFAFEELRLPRLISIAQPANTGSIDVMRRLGMRFERSARHGDLGLKNPEIEISIYALESGSGRSRDVL
ncbi:MAG TPA: GNAT family N-acetyltransferase [Kofleriaceae bacterium]|nr:GNAT family N-acetyltransferase [Kofleriaceae bacterium]